MPFTPSSSGKFCAFLPAAMSKAAETDSVRGLGVHSGPEAPLTAVPAQSGGAGDAPEHLRAGAPAPPRPGRGIRLSVVFTLNSSAQQTHYLGTRIKSHSLYFN